MEEENAGIVRKDPEDPQISILRWFSDSYCNAGSSDPPSQHDSVEGIVRGPRNGDERSLTAAEALRVMGIFDGIRSKPGTSRRERHGLGRWL